MTRALPRFYLIVDGNAWLERLLPIGVRLVQLRIKDSPCEALRVQIRQAKQLCMNIGAQLIVNDHWQLALDEGCDFVHLGQGDLDSADLIAIRRAGMRFGVSTHDHAELERALTLRPNYIALGPIYPTVLKQMPWAPQGLERIAEWKRRIARIADTPLAAPPLVAIGGLTVERAPDVFAAGADSIAVVTDVLRHPQPEMRTREWLAVA